MGSVHCNNDWINDTCDVRQHEQNDNNNDYCLTVNTKYNKYK